MLKDVEDIRLFDKGHRALIYIGKYRDKKVAIKIKKPSSKAQGIIENESKWLKILNKKGIGPKLIMAKKDYFVYEFIEGELFYKWFRNKSKKDVIKVIQEVFKKMRIMDKIKVDKKEMHNPFKHIIIGKQIKLIDFERCHKVDKPKNVTQFCQFLIRPQFKQYFKINRNKLIGLLKKYKNKQDEETYKKILKIFS